MEWVDVEQNTDEWLDLRLGRIGGSSISKIMANYGKPFGDPAHAEALRIAIEKITGKRNEQNYSNGHMERGHEQEPIARMLYEESAFCDVSNGGYYIVDDYTGVSPDGRVDDAGLIEIKCVIGTVHFDTVKRCSYDPKYKWQLALNLKSSGRSWIDYVEYCSEFPSGKQLFVQRVTADDCAEMFEMIELRIAEFIKLVEYKIEIIQNIQ